MMTRPGPFPRAALTLLLLPLGGSPMLAADDGAKDLVLEPGKEAIVACDTRSVVVADSGAKATSGTIKLGLTLDPPEANPPPAAALNDDTRHGSWRPVVVPADHGGAFAKTFDAACAKGCPMAVQSSGETQLWAPKPTSLDQLGEGEALLLAILKPESGSLRASTFRGKAIESLEEGTCRKDTP